MELELIRTYFESGTNGTIFFRDRMVTNTIELPWKNNQARISCIPEGRYQLIKRWNQKFYRHLQVLNVAQRSYILIHPANDALHELKGCIAPVTVITGAGKGLQSRKALEMLISLVYEVFDRQEPVFITIKSDKNEPD